MEFFQGWWTGNILKVNVFTNKPILVLSGLVTRFTTSRQKLVAMFITKVIQIRFVGVTTTTTTNEQTTTTCSADVHEIRPT